MARRSRSIGAEARDSLPLLQLSLVLGGMYLIATYFDTIMLIVSFILGAAALLICGYLVFRNHRQRVDRDRLQQHLTIKMKEHETALVVYFRQSISRDAFGNMDDRKWLGHIDVFLRTQIVPNVPDYQVWRNSRMGHEAATTVDRFTRQKDEMKKRENPLTAIKAHRISPDEYEQLCADILEGLGWNAQVTQSTRDHGADVIAEKSGVRVIIQCKRYAQPVGNKGVQEAHSALHLYAGDMACVVAPSGFTPQAQREAHGLGVKLLHHSALGDLDHMIGIKPLHRLAEIKRRALEQ